MSNTMSREHVIRPILLSQHAVQALRMPIDDSGKSLVHTSVLASRAPRRISQL